MVLYPGMEHLLYLEVYGMSEGEVLIEGELVDEKSVRRRKLDRLGARERRQLDKWVLDLERSSGDQDILSKMNLIGPRLRPALEAIPVDTLRGGARNVVLEALDRLQQ